MYKCKKCELNPVKFEDDILKYSDDNFDDVIEVIEEKLQ